jgi:hypothetical protein
MLCLEGRVVRLNVWLNGRLRRKKKGSPPQASSRVGWVGRGYECQTQREGMHDWKGWNHGPWETANLLRIMAGTQFWAQYCTSLTIPLKPHAPKKITLKPHSVFTCISSWSVFMHYFCKILWHMRPPWNWENGYTSMIFCDFCVGCIWWWLEQRPIYWKMWSWSWTAKSSVWVMKRFHLGGGCFIDETCIVDIFVLSFLGGILDRKFLCLLDAKQDRIRFMCISLAKVLHFISLFLIWSSAILSLACHFLMSYDISYMRTWSKGPGRWSCSSATRTELWYAHGRIRVSVCQFA